MIAGVLFDLGGTLLDYVGSGWNAAFRAVYDELPPDLRGEWPAFREWLPQLEDRLWREATGGRANLTAEGEMAELLRELGIPLDAALQTRCADAYGRALQAGCAVYSDAASTLAALKARGLRIGLISNTVLPGELHREDLARFGLLGYFDDLVFSADVGLWKPQSAVFRLALEHLNLRSAEAVFVGDRLVDDVGGARTAGLRAILRVLPENAQENAAGEALGIRPDGRIATLAELPELVDRLDGRRGPRDAAGV